MKTLAILIALSFGLSYSQAQATPLLQGQIIAKVFTSVAFAKNKKKMKKKKKAAKRKKAKKKRLAKKRAKRKKARKKAQQIQKQKMINMAILQAMHVPPPTPHPPVKQFKNGGSLSEVPGLAGLMPKGPLPFHCAESLQIERECQDGSSSRVIGKNCNICPEDLEELAKNIPRLPASAQPQSGAQYKSVHSAQ